MTKKPVPPPPSEPNSREFEMEQTRFVRIHRYLLELLNDKRRNYPTWAEFAADVEEPLTTLKRSVRRMRDQWNLPIGPCPERGGGIGYTEPVTHFPLFTITERQAAVLGLVQQLMTLLEGTPMFGDFRDVLRKAFANMPEDFTEVFHQFRHAVSFHTIGVAAPAALDWELFSTCVRAVIEQGELELDHCSAKPGAKPKKIVVHPRHVANINHAWYLFFDVPGSSEPPIKYALTRIRSATRAGKTFHPTRPFDIHAELDFGLGAFNDRNTQEVHIRFSADVATIIRERKWHRKQVTKLNADGTLDVKLNVCLTPELDGILLPWAGHMKVISPTPLIGRMRAAGEALLRDHPVSDA